MNKTIEIIKDIRILCTHIFEGGHRCASPALQREAFCSYHHPTRKPVKKTTRAELTANPSTSHSPPLNRTSREPSTK